MAKKVKNKNQLRANGHINIPNVGATSECIGLTYTIRGIKSLKQVDNIEDELDGTHDLESHVDVELGHYNTEEQEIIMKYKVKACGDDSTARKVKEKCDKKLKTLGGQTVLDAPEAEAEE